MARVPFAHPVNALDTNPAFTGRGVWRGFCFTNPTGGPLDVTVTDDSGSGTGMNLGTITVPAHETEFQFPGTSGVLVEQGLNVAVAAGITPATVYVTTETPVAPGVAVYDDDTIDL